MSGEQLMTETEAAELLGLAKHTLAVWRTTKRYGIPYLKVGRLVRYRHRDLIAFLDRRTVGTIDDVAALATV